ncbi:MAG: hypothetical protein LQ352_002392 [Teloschistes flavicans]|nr:MAG: hypothetical protein LQ352_002392 [Teloschistes flavicans]
MTDHEVSESQTPSYTDLLGTIQYLLEDRKRLSEHLALANGTVEEFRQLAQHAHILSRNAAEATTLSSNSSRFKKSIGEANTASTWIGGSWLAPSVAALGPAEKLWQDGQAQQALILVGSLLRQPAPTVSEDVHARLFISALLRASGDLGQAHKHAEDALVMAKEARAAQEADSFMLVSKAEFHRGLCFMKMGRYAQAHWCLVLASHLEGHEEQIEANRVFAMEKCQELGMGDEGRRIDLSYI